MGMMVEGAVGSPGVSPMCSGSPYGQSCFVDTLYAESLYPENLYCETAYPEYRIAAGRSPRSGRGSRTGRQPQFDTQEVRQGGLRVRD